MNVLPLLLRRIGIARNERLDRATFERRRLKRFRKLVAHAQRHSPYYADLIREHDIVVEQCQPQDFPVLTKSILLDNFDRIVTDRRVTKQKITDFLAHSRDPLELLGGEFYVLHTSGSSGEVGYFVFSRDDWARGYAQVLRAHKTPIRKLKVGFFGVTGGHHAGVTLSLSGSRIGGRQNFDLQTHDIQQSLQTTVEQLNALQPDQLVSYAGGLRMLAEQKMQGNLRIHPSAIDSSGEPLTPAQHRFIESVFDVPVQNVYASTEFMFMGLSRGDDGMTLLEDDLIFELHDDHTCVTGLFNYTMPLIRYRMSDVIIPKQNNGSHKPYMHIKEVIGRMEQAPVFINRYGQQDTISPHVINEIYVKHLRRFQMQITGKDSFVFRACLESGITPHEHSSAIGMLTDQLKAMLSAKSMDNVRFEIREVDSIGPDKLTGKFRLILPMN